MNTTTTTIETVETRTILTICRIANEIVYAEEEISNGSYWLARASEEIAWALSDGSALSSLGVHQGRAAAIDTAIGRRCAASTNLNAMIALLVDTDLAKVEQGALWQLAYLCRKHVTVRTVLGAGLVGKIEAAATVVE